MTPSRLDSVMRDFLFIDFARGIWRLALKMILCVGNLPSGRQFKQEP
jgi:hypothetical protein